ncbi:MAG: TIGR03985 family CRISPR-associated protein [Okeania sp. SIO3B5]|uniref:TIGR03985 family CRISPR-associated protein n=1 Tax=Okeania sp. SIO3B5 TaxID=2607811 RepID=UPI001400F10F|nr:TIGR03985 family CRISPR-associated protein [Okeania sp. SIO3B5]NEO54045.1 TIGR03985 family CRISPR-associated protein [Okeania sp. SIO3B5]
MNQENFTTSDADVFNFPPDVEFLQILARGSLKQNLPKAVRLWVILYSIYGDEADPIKVKLADQFTYNDWCKKFFTEFEHHKNDKIPIYHDPKCPCAKTIPDWLFEPTMGSNAREWKKSFIQLYPITLQQLNNLLNFGIINTQKNQTKQQKIRLLAKTRKNFQYDFQALVSMGWLRARQVKNNHHLNKFQTQYIKVNSFPGLPRNLPSQEVVENQQVGNVIQNDLVDFFDDFGREINHEQRFFLELEYIVHQQLLSRINEFREKLKKIWDSQPIPPIKITYVSARNFQDRQDKGENYIVYPVCIYYSQRAPYLFAYGQTPKDDSGTKINWYDYRLDRIKSLEVLDWNGINLPNFSLKICQSKTPAEIEKKRSEAWGFDFYKPQDVLLIRFDKYFHNLYIKGTERENLFKKISYKQAQSLINNSKEKLEQKQQLLRVLKSRSPKDIYCRVNYRKDDYNVIMRLRAWGAKVEVLSPWDLRQTMTENIQDTWKLYRS